MNRKKIIAVDLDDVIADLHIKLEEYYNDKFGKNLKSEDYHTFFLTKIWNMSSDQVMKELFLFYNSKYFFQTKPVKGARKVLRKLSENYKLYLVTSRPEETQKDTIKWMEEYFPDMFEDYFFTNGITKDSSKTIKKSQVCKKINANVFIDDAPHYIEDASEVVDRSFLFTQPWNKNFKSLPQNCKRVDSWNEIFIE